jgi:hypothetical protein
MVVINNQQMLGGCFKIAFFTTESWQIKILFFAQNHVKLFLRYFLVRNELNGYLIVLDNFSGNSAIGY